MSVYDGKHKADSLARALFMRAVFLFLEARCAGFNEGVCVIVGA